MTVLTKEHRHDYDHGKWQGQAECKAMRYESHGLHEYASVREARVALQNSRIRHAALDNSVQADMAEWMWRNLASPEDAAIAFGLELPDE